MNKFEKKILKIIRYINTKIGDLLDWMDWQKTRLREIRKFQDPRRVKIFSQIELTRKQKRQIDEFYLKNYGKKIPYIWHQYYTAFTGNFDVKYFPELLHIPELERYMLSYFPSYEKVLADKNILPYLAQSVGVNSPKLICSCVNGYFRDASGQTLTKSAFENFLGDIGEAFVKPSIDSDSGRGCAAVDMHSGVDKLSKKSVKELIKQLGENFVVQERLNSHPALTALYPHSVNTFRIITYRWKENIFHAPIILRIGQGGNIVDNAHAGGMFIAVENDGTLHKTAFTEFNTRYQQHPDTHIVFEKYKIPYVRNLILSAIRIHSLLPQLGIYNWDFTLNQQGEPILIEANTIGGAVWVVQMAHGKAIFDDKTAEILQWMAFMKKLPASKRKFYKPGYIE